MNERIKQLAHKADFIFKKNNGAEWRWGYIDPELAEKLEKFAELIVQECMEQVWYTREDGINGNVSEVIKERMKQHFGVEE
jgi:hypothetical protein